MTKHTIIATDTLLTSEGLKHAGETFEVTSDVAAEKMQKRGHLLAGSKEAEAFLASGSKKKPKHANKAFVPPSNKADDNDGKDEGADKKPLNKMNLAELQAEATSKEIAFDEKTTKKELIALIEAKADDNDEGADLA